MEYENLRDELLSAVDTGLRFAKTVEKEAEFELYLFYQNSARADVRQGVVEATDGIITGNAVRTAMQKRVGFASSSGISIDRIKRTIIEAVESIRSVSITDERFKGFCEPNMPGKEGAFASEIVSLGKEELIQFAQSLTKEGQEFNKKISYAECSCSAEWGGFAVGNTRGLQQASRSASNSCHVYCMATDKDERRVGNEYDVTRERLIKSDGLGESAARKALDLLGARKLNETKVLPTIWDPIAAASYVLPSLAQSANGRAVVEGLSPLARKIGKKIAHPSLTIIDDGQKPSSLNTEAIDGEGHPQQRNIIVEKGTLKQFMLDTYYGHVYGTQSTGNCSRGGGPFGSTLPYETSPTVSHKHLEIMPGKKSREDIIDSIEAKAILIVDIPIGIFHSSVSTGEFSIVANSAFLVEKGEKKGPLQPVSVAGNFYKGFEQLIEIGNDLQVTPLTVETPTLMFDGFSIVG